jgi:peptidoglycan/LPS O-acetylase OafA/YrhL
VTTTENSLSRAGTAPRYPHPGGSTALGTILAYRLGKLKDLRLLRGVWLDRCCTDGGYTEALVAWGAKKTIGVDPEQSRIDQAVARERLPVFELYRWMPAGVISAYPRLMPLIEKTAFAEIRRFDSGGGAPPRGRRTGTRSSPRRIGVRIDYRHFGALRFLLATLVMLQHFLGNVAPEPLATASLPYEFGSVAVLVFFALSGFVISEAADRIYAGRPVAFMVNRLLRILPHFLLATTAAILLYVLFDLTGTLRLSRGDIWNPNTAFAPLNIAVNLLSFLPIGGRLATYSFLPIAWAVGIEMVFYILLAIALAVAQTTGKTPFRLSLPAAGLGIAVALAPLFILNIAGRAPPMFGFEPYFVYGCALYFALNGGGRIAWAIAVVACAGMAAHFLGQPAHHPVLGFRRAVGTEFAVLVALLGIMTALARVRIGRLRAADQALGDFTYPLYLWHLDVMILVLSVTTGSSYAGLIAAVLLSLFATYGLRAVVDRNIDMLRDAVRGGRVRKYVHYDPALRKGVAADPS